MQLEQLTKKLNRPEYKHDTAAKVYIVYDEFGNEYSRHQYKDIWNSSPAMRAAQTDVLKLKDEGWQKQKLEYENRPLSKYEERYMAVDHLFKKWMTALKSKTLTDDEKNKYYEIISSWSSEMDDLIKTKQIRSSVIDGTYKPTQ